jgi:hypothetical protein
MTDKNKAPENGENPPILPPKIIERLGGSILPAAAKARESEPRETGRPESPKRKLKVSLLRWLLILTSAMVLAFVFFGKPIKGCSNKSAGSQAEVAPEASSMPIRTMKPRVSAPAPTDAEIDAAPAAPAGNDLSPSSTKI